MLNANNVSGGIIRNAWTKAPFQKLLNRKNSSVDPAKIFKRCWEKFNNPKN